MTRWPLIQSPAALVIAALVWSTGGRAELKMNGPVENHQNKDAVGSAMDVEKSAPNDSAPNGGTASAADSTDPTQLPNSVWPIKDSDGYVVVPFTYGSVALWQGKRAPEFQTFRW